MLNSHLPKPTPECFFFADLLPVLGEETLPEPEASEARAHLAACAYCQHEYAAYQRVDAHLRRHFSALPSLRFEPEDIMMLPDGSTPSDPAPDTAPAPVQPTRPRRRRRVVSLFSLVAAALVIIVVVTAIVVSRGPAPQHTGTTHPVVSSPTLAPAPPETAYVPTKNDGFGVIQMLSPTEGWAVGSVVIVAANNGTATPLIVHYHDGHWLRVAVPGSEQLGLSNPQLYSISMVSPDEGWIVGGGGDFQQGRTTTAFILHYSGGRWTRYGSLMQNTRLNQVQMLSPTDGWMVGVGNLQFATQHISLILHYDGKHWAPVQAPSVQDIGGLDMLSATDGWATGLSTVLHYDGQRWTVFQQILQISELSMGSASDGWAVAGDPSNDRNALLWHYNGNQWVQSVTLTSASTTVGKDVIALSMDSATDGWALGVEYPYSNSGAGIQTEFFLHYSQGRWTQVPMPRGIYLVTLTMISADEGWAAGEGGVFMHYQHGSWRQYQS